MVCSTTTIKCNFRLRDPQKHTCGPPKYARKHPLVVPAPVENIGRVQFSAHPRENACHGEPSTVMLDVDIGVRTPPHAPPPLTSRNAAAAGVVRTLDTHCAQRAS